MLEHVGKKEKQFYAPGSCLLQPQVFQKQVKREWNVASKQILVSSVHHSTYAHRCKITTYVCVSVCISMYTYSGDLIEIIYSHYI